MTRLRGEQGFTLVELLVAAMLSLIVFGATLNILDTYNRQSTANTQRNNAQDMARLGIDRIVRQLRNIASPVTTPKLLERATPYDVVFQTVGAQHGLNTTGAQRVRYCIPNDSPASASTEVLINETQTWSTTDPPASPWSSDPNVTVPCPDSPAPASTTITPIAWSVTNRYGGLDRGAFAFNNGLDANKVAAADLPKVTSVQIDLFSNPTPTLASSGTEIRSAAYLRNQIHAPVSQFTSSPTGGGGILLNGGISYSPDGFDLSYNWACVSAGCPAAAAAALAGSSDALVNWQPGPGTYTVQLTVSDPSGLSTTSDPQQVTVT